MFDTSCDELEEDEDVDYTDPDLVHMDDDDDARVDDLFDGSAASSKASKSMNAIDQILDSDGGGGGGGGRGGRRRVEHASLTCFGCAYSSLNDANDKFIDGDKMNNLIRIFDDLHGRTDSKVLARMCHIFYMSQIYWPLRTQGKRVPVWRTRQIHEHFTKHQLEPRVMLATQIRSYERLSAALEETSFVATTGGSRLKPNKDNLALKLRIDGHLLRLYAIDAGKLNFHNPNCKIDFQRMGLLMGPYRHFS